MNPQVIKLDAFVEKVKDFECVMCSTLNQIVNFIPLFLGNIRVSSILTIDGNSEFPASEWNENLNRVLGNNGFNSNQLPEELPISQEQSTSIAHIESTLLKRKSASSNKKVLWNITGGQRPYVLAVQRLAKIGDIVAYIEGSAGELILYTVTHEGIGKSCYKLEIDLRNKLKFAAALSLMGFKYQEGQGRTADKSDLLNHQFRSFFEKLSDEFCRNTELRRALILSNKQTLSREDAKTNVRELLIASESDFEQTDIEAFINEYFARQVKYPFGYILEYLVVFTILNNDEISSELADICVSANLYFEDSNTKSMIDEFDIVMLTKAGQIIMIECKSGGMSGDVAKSTKYSVYAAAGVYGMPILITSLLESEFDDDEVLAMESYKEVFAAYRSATRASLTVWGLDTLIDKLQAKLSL